MAAARVAVVGAGLAGLSAALDLKDAGIQVDLFERSRLYGGRATSFVVDGNEVDNGQHVFLACCDAFIGFVRRVGMAQTLHIQERFDVVAFRHGVRARLRAAPLPAPWHLAASFLGYAHLGVRVRIAVARALLNLGSASAGETFAAWLERERQPADAVRAFWEPFVVPALNAPLERVSAADAAFVLTTAFLRSAGAARFGWCTVPLAHIAAAAAERLDAVRLQCAVTAIDARAGSVTLSLLDGARESYDAVVLAVPPPQLARMLGDASRFGLADLNAYEPFPIVDIHIWYSGGEADFTFAALLESPIQWVFRKGDGYLCCSASAAGDMLTASTDDVIRRAWDELRSAIPSLAAARLHSGAVTRNPSATYLPRAGVVRPGAATTNPLVAIAGAWTATGWPDTMESAVRSGRSAASATVEGLTSAAGEARLPA